jgi:hypothetical protein
MTKKKDRGQQGPAAPTDHSFQGGDQLIVCLLVDTYFETAGEEGDELVPAETRLVGIWDEEQPSESHLCRIRILLGVVPVDTIQYLNRPYPDRGYSLVSASFGFQDTGK